MSCFRLQFLALLCTALRFQFCVGPTGVLSVVPLSSSTQYSNSKTENNNDKIRWNDSRQTHGSGPPEFQPNFYAGFWPHYPGGYIGYLNLQERGQDWSSTHSIGKIIFSHLRASLMDMCNSEKQTHVLHVSFRQDATNARPKNCTLELDVAWSSYAVPLEQGADWHNDCHRIRRTSDVLPVGDESGIGCLAFTIKALKSLGCPTWMDLQGASWDKLLVFELEKRVNHLVAKAGSLWVSDAWKSVILHSTYLRQPGLCVRALR